MRKVHFDNAAGRKTFIGLVHAAGVQAVQERVLMDLPPELADLHRQGWIHIHDLDAYGLTYNCLQMDVLRRFPWARFRALREARRIPALLDYYRDLVVKLGNEQSGGIGSPNFDLELETAFARLELTDSEPNLEALRVALEGFVEWTNAARDRGGQTTYYLTLNLGLATGRVGRFATRALLEHFGSVGRALVKPNIVFKVKRGVSASRGDPNRDLLELALECTSHRMIPTYLLCDAEPNACCAPELLGIMGCRTRVVANTCGESRSVGRGNLAYVTVNLPRLALEVDRNHPDEPVASRLAHFEARWDEVAGAVQKLLLDRYRRLLALGADDFPCNRDFGLWLRDFAPGESLEPVFRNGTLSIGFIGLSEVVEILTREKFWASAAGYAAALDVVRHMRRVVDGWRTATGLNFTLLATSGELVSGRFPDLDARCFSHPVIRKRFYTNSFHVDVDSELGPFEKLQLEGPFHALANGGAISYVELASPPLGNVAALDDLVGSAVAAGVSYLGVNFPLDECRACGQQGTFDRCPACASANVLRVRRVSGYLEDLDYFTPGKKAEVARRRPNADPGARDEPCTSR